MNERTSAWSCPRGDPAGGVVDRLVQAVASAETQRVQALQVWQAASGATINAIIVA
jgi:hypothetical protein